MLKSGTANRSSTWSSVHANTPLFDVATSTTPLRAFTGQYVTSVSLSRVSPFPSRERNTWSLQSLLKPDGGLSSLRVYCETHLYPTDFVLYTSSLKTGRTTTVCSSSAASIYTHVYYVLVRDLSGRQALSFRRDRAPNDICDIFPTIFDRYHSCSKLCSFAVRNSHARVVLYQTRVSLSLSLSLVLCVCVCFARNVPFDARPQDGL